jgi:lipoprotein NlpI
MHGSDELIAAVPQLPTDGIRASVAHACLAAFLLLVTAFPAHCVEPDSDLARQLQAERRQRMERIIARSSAQIESGNVEGRELAAAFRARSLARSALLQHAEALTDITRAVELDPFNPQYYEERARAYLKLREFQPAGEDLEMALGLDNRRWSAQRDKGRVLAYQGAFADAAAQFSRALRLSDQETAPYNALWLDLALRRAGRDGTGVVDRILEDLDAKDWPVPVLAAYRGRISAEAMLAAAGTADPRKAIAEKCEAYFYAGQLYLINGDPAQAKAAFTAAAGTAAVEHLEYDWALRELELLEAKVPAR